MQLSGGRFLVAELSDWKWVAYFVICVCMCVFAWHCLVGSGEGREKGSLNISKRRQKHLCVVRSVHHICITIY